MKTLVKKFSPSRWLILTFLGLVLIALLTRGWRYAYFPDGGETADEFAWTLLGASLIQEGIPTSWSFFPVYEGYHYQEGAYNAPIVRPALDHPPLFSFLPGIAQNLKGHWLEQPSLKVIRAPMVALGVINVILFWFVLRKMFTARWVMVGMSLFLTIPSLVFGSRLVVAENLLITWFLLAMLLIAKPKNKENLFAVVLVSAAAVLTKMSGIILPAALIAYGLYTKQRQLVRASLIGGLLGIGVFVLYGAFYNWSLFVAVLSTQSTRELGLATLQNRLFLNPTIVRHTFFDGWQLLGLFAWVWLLLQTKAKQQKNQLFIHLLTLFSLLFVAMTVGENTLHGWYDFVLWPMLVISLTAFFKAIWQSQNGLLISLGWLLLLPSTRLLLMFSGQYSQLGTWFLRAIILAGLVPFGWQLLGKKHWAKKTMIGLFCLLLLINLAVLFTLNNEAYWIQAAFFGSPQ